jgi:hypothetical protein
MKFEKITKLMAEGWSLRPISATACGYHLRGPNGEFPPDEDSAYVNQDQARRLKPASSFGDKVAGTYNTENEVVTAFLKGETITTICEDTIWKSAQVERIIRHEMKELRGQVGLADGVISSLDKTNCRANDRLGIVKAALNAGRNDFAKWYINATDDEIVKLNKEVGR